MITMETKTLGRTQRQPDDKRKKIEDEMIMAQKKQVPFTRSKKRTTKAYGRELEMSRYSYLTFAAPNIMHPDKQARIQEELDFWNLHQETSNTPIHHLCIGDMPTGVPIFMGLGLIDHIRFNQAKHKLPDGFSAYVRFVMIRSYGRCRKVYHTMTANFTRKDRLDEDKRVQYPYTIYQLGAKLTQKHRLPTLLPFDDDRWEYYNS